MRYRYLAFAGGIAAFQLMPHFPSPLLYGSVVPLILCAWRWPRSRFGVLLGLGFLWGMFRADLVLSARLPAQFAGQVISVQGAVSKLSSLDHGTARFDFSVTSAATYGGQSLPLDNLKLAWYRVEMPPEVGAVCDLKVRLKLPLGTHNAGVFDREKWLFTQRISAVGYVMEYPSNDCGISLAKWHPSRIREAVKASITSALNRPEQRAVISALAIADRSELSDAHWETLTATGTAHLFAISGLHISLVAALALLALHWVIGLSSPRDRTWPVQRPAIVAALCAAAAYAALAGFPTSAQRALIMLFVALGSQFLRRPAISLDSFCLAFALVAVLDPLALLSASFWLSFCAVGWLLLITTTRVEPSKIIRLIRLHVFLALGLTPLLGVLHQSIPSASPLANLIAVPVVTIAIVPLVILGILVSPFNLAAGAMLWKAAVAVWEPLWLYLQWLAANVAPFELSAMPSWLAMSMAFAGVCLLLIPILRARWIAAFVLVATLTMGRPPDIGFGELRFTVLDVGQGLAAVVQTANHVLVYDTGLSFGDYSSGKSIVAPFLRARAVKHIDRIVISHADSDHAGGLRGLLSVIPARDVIVSPAHNFEVNHSDCENGQTWHWDGIKFTFLHPNKRSVGSKNDLSCVLLISAPGGRILLPGDIEIGAENELLESSRKALSVDIVIAPHHGSATSSGPEFISATNPRYVVFATGYANRFNFPHDAVVSRYLNAEAITLNTGTDGAVSFDVTRDISTPRMSRSSNARYWQQRPLSESKS